MTQIAIGATSNAYLPPGEKLSLAGNGGFASIVVTSDLGGVSTTPFGPGPDRRVIGPHSNGVSVVITNISCDTLVQVGGYSPAAVSRNSLGAVTGFADPQNGSQIPINLRPTNVYARRTLGSDKSAGGTSTHQEQTTVPMGGMLADVSIEVQNDSTTTDLTVVACAFAGSNAYGGFNPSGAWVSGATNLVAAQTTNAVQPTVLQVPVQRIYLPPDTVDPKWSTVFTRGKYTNARIWGSNVASLYNTVAQKHKSRLDFHAVTNITDAFPNPPTGVDIGLRSSIPIIRPVTAFSARTCSFFGDSRTRGQGSTSDDYGWSQRAVESIATQFSDLVSHENASVSGTQTSQFLEKFNVLATNRLPDLVYFQPFSTNNTNPFTAATIASCLATLDNVAAECKRRGIAFITSTQYPSVAVTSADTLQQFLFANDYVRKNYPGRYIEFFNSDLTDLTGAFPALKTVYQADSQHCNDFGHLYASTLAIPVIKRGLGLNP